MNLLEHLNPEQLAAVTLPNQSALILAGAGSGKTRVLTTRIAWLIQTGNVSPQGVLAVTFTNKAAREMTTRLAAMMPINTRGMWIGTFHGLCNRLLRAHFRDAGLPQLFQILDTQDQLSAVKRVLAGMNADTDKFPPKQVQYFINDAKEEGQRAKDVPIHDDMSRRYAEFFAAYDEQCQREGVVDFPELLLRSYELLSKNQILREHYQRRFSHILVDEFQDTNRLQYRWLKLLAGSAEAAAQGREPNVVLAVGDDDQCLVEGTKISMADGTRRAIERIRVGDQVLSCFGSGGLRAASVEKVFRKPGRHEIVRIRLASGRVIESTPEHTHFAGFVAGHSPQRHFVYLMHKRGIGYRIGTTQVYTQGQRRPMLGFMQRCLQEHGDALWILGSHASENLARAEEEILSLKFGLPKLPFVPRKGKGVNGLVHDSKFLKQVFAALDTSAAAARLLHERGLSLEQPHHQPRSRDSNRRNIVVTLCADQRGRSPTHRVAVMGNDADGRRRLEALGHQVRAAKKNSDSWRVETVRRDFSEAMQMAEQLRRALSGQLVLKARLHDQTLPFIQAAAVRPGMMMMDEQGKPDVVTETERKPGQRVTVYDLNISPTHNFVANGVVTHNSIYAFRGANVGNMADFERDFKVQNVIRLEQNYRSFGNILNTANALISNNTNRLGKNLWTDAGEGEPVRVYEAATDGYEAHWIAEEVKSLVAEGHMRSDIAVLYRSNAQSRVIEHALFSQGIAYRVYGGLRFFERQEVKHALAYLRLLANADDDGAFLRVVNFPTRGIGARSIEQLQDAARAAGCSLSAAVPMLSGKAGASLGNFARLIEGLREQTRELMLPEVIEHMLERSGLMAHYRAEREGADRLENLSELINAGAAFIQEADGVIESGDLAAFLAHAALEAGDNQAAEGKDAVQMMTIHAAKGLEFHAVFVTGIEEGLFPHEQSVMQNDGLEEERRLMYVAITRARTRLYLSFTQQRLLHGQTRYNVPSRFLDELPAELLKWLTPRMQGRGQGAYGASASAQSWGGGYGSSAAAGSGTGSSSAAAATSASFGAGKTSERGGGWRIGQSVQHAKFGQGVIVSAEGSGSDARLQINFGRAGMKWLALEYAKLTAV